MERRIGRDRECEELSRAMESSRSEFVVLYGRRRIGKTFLVRSFFKDRFDFHYVGAHKAKTVVQLQNFRKALIRYGDNANIPSFSNWMEAFEYLASWLERMEPAKRKILFFDEMPWIDAKQSDFVAALEYFWNSWVSMRDDIFLIACGSATSWMADKLIDNPGGLHNRITRRIYLRPFTLHECEEYLESRGFDWDRYQIIQCYMALGGVPFYWSLLEKEFSLPQNIDRLCFRMDGMLRTEFDELYSALFSNAERYISVVRTLANHREGMTREEIMEATRLTGGNLSKVLKNLERCDFITSYAQFGLLVASLSDAIGCNLARIDLRTCVSCAFAANQKGAGHFRHGDSSLYMAIYPRQDFKTGSPRKRRANRLAHRTCRQNRPFVRSQVLRREICDYEGIRTAFAGAA